MSGRCDTHARMMRKAGETDERMHALAAWRDAPYFTDAERAAPALTEAVTRLSDLPDPVHDDVWREPLVTTTRPGSRYCSSRSRASTSGTGSTWPHVRLRARSSGTRAGLTRPPAEALMIATLSVERK